MRPWPASKKLFEEHSQIRLLPLFIILPFLLGVIRYTVYIYIYINNLFLEDGPVELLQFFTTKHAWSPFSPLGHPPCRVASRRDRAPSSWVLAVPKGLRLVTVPRMADGRPG